MKVVPFSQKYVPKMVELFLEEYSENQLWDKTTAQAYIEDRLTDYPTYCLAALSEDSVFLGAILCSIHPYYTGKSLLIDLVHVDKPFRKTGVSKALIKAVTIKAQSDAVSWIHLYADSRKQFPMSWYERIGFKKSHWIEYEIKLANLKLE